MKQTFKTRILTSILAGLVAVGGAGCGAPIARTDRDISENLRLKRAGDNSLVYKSENYQMESGYALPQDLEVQVRDMNGNGRFELTVSLGTNDYLVRSDGTNNLRIIPYVKKVAITELDQ